METKWCKMHCDMQLYKKQPVITNNVYCVSDINNLPKEQIQIALDNFEKKYNWTQWTIEDAEKRCREKWNLYLIETKDSSIIGWVWVSFEGEVLNAYSNPGGGTQGDAITVRFLANASPFVVPISIHSTCAISNGTVFELI